MTNPNNAVGTNGAYNGRTSVEAFNDIMSIFEGRGVLSGWACVPSSGMTVALGGVSGTRDVAVAEDASGNFTSINNISGSPVEVALSAAPASNSRIDSIVAYVTNPPQGEETVLDNPDACGIIAVSGTASSSPSAPNDSQIRTAITGDGGSGSTAFYVVLANITVAAGTTDITSDVITAGALPVASGLSTPEIITQGVWTIYKFPSGFMIQRCNYEFTGVGITTAQGSIYASGEISLPNFAIPFTATPSVSTDLISTTWQCGLVKGANDAVASATTPGGVRLTRGNSTGSSTVNGTISVMAMGV